jgi:HK97 gp10 family phage protein
MMAKIIVKTEGLSELNKNLQKFSMEIKDKLLRAAVRAAGKVVVEKAKANVVAQGLVKSGAMRDAIRARRLSRASKDPNKEFSVVGVFKIPGGKYANTKLNRRKMRVGQDYEVDPPEFYWKFHEFGTVRMKKRPFLVPAFDSTKKDLPVVMEKSLKAGMEKATRKLSKTTLAKRRR